MEKTINPLISVIIPIYNVEAYLERCINSVINQTYENLEIILIDDGSTDGCPIICDKYAENDERVIVIHQENKGLGAARNTGLDIFKGEWVCFLDSDDWIDANCVEVLLSVAVNNNCLLSVCKMLLVSYESECSNYTAQYSKTKVLNWREYLIFALTEDKTSPYGHYAYNSANTKLYNHRLIKNNRFYNFRVGEDVASAHLFLNACQENNSNIAITDLCKYNYFQRPESIMNSATSLKWLDLLNGYDVLLDFYERKSELEIFNLYWREYFYWCVELAYNFSIDIPQYKEELDSIIKRIISDKQKALEMTHPALELSLDARHNWNKIASSDKKIVLYGYGKNGKRFLNRLLYFNIPIVEIWDNAATEGQTDNEIPIKKMHGGFIGQDVMILNSMYYMDIMYQVNYQLRTLGYKNIMFCGAVDNALKYAKYARFLPFLLEKEYGNENI